MSSEDVDASTAHQFDEAPVVRSEAVGPTTSGGPITQPRWIRPGSRLEGVPREEPVQPEWVPRYQHHERLQRTSEREQAEQTGRVGSMPMSQTHHQEAAISAPEPLPRAR